MTPTGVPTVLFLAKQYAGHRTRFLNLLEHTIVDRRIRPEYSLVSGWTKNGRLENLRLLPAGLRGRMRAAMEAGAFARMPRPDVIWSSADEVLAPYCWSQVGSLRRPLVLDLDASPQQLEDDAHLFLGRPPHRGARRAFGRLTRSIVWNSVTRFSVWSNWAADGLGRAGVPAYRIRVLPPGVDLDLWRPANHTKKGKIKLLFVGADFTRKGGPMLLDVLKSRTDQFDLDIVTRADIAPAPWYRVHRAEPNSPALRSLYRAADLFVLPTRAECFGIAAIEAMASGVPVVMCDVGAAREIVDDRKTGFLIGRGPGELAAALDVAAQSPEHLARMGQRARAVAELRFDGRRNDRRVVDLLLEEHERFTGETRARRLKTAEER